MAKRKNYPATRKVATRESLLGAELKTKEVDLPELGQVVYVREMSALQISQRAQRLIDKNGNFDRRKLSEIETGFVLTQAIDEDGNRLFEDTDRQAIEGMPASVVNRIARAVNEMSGIRDVDAGDLAEWLEENYPAIYDEFKGGPIGEYEENFTITPNGDLPTV